MLAPLADSLYSAHTAYEMLTLDDALRAYLSIWGLVSEAGALYAGEGALLILSRFSCVHTPQPKGVGHVSGSTTISWYNMHMANPLALIFTPL